MCDQCPHFGQCGGCRMQDVPYPEQVARKGATLEALFQDVWHAPITVEPSPAIWNYRNKVDFNFGRKWYDEKPPEGFVRESVLGFKARGRWFAPLDIDECRIGPEGLAALLESVRRWMHAQGLQAFDSRTDEGLLKILLVREGKRTGQRMVVLITGEGDFDRASFVEVVQNAFPSTSIYRGIFRGRADVAFADETELLDGTPTIEERLKIDNDLQELRFRISPFSFFQTNTLAAEKLYGAIRRWVTATAPTILYDLYGGAGGIAFACANLVQQVRSVDTVVSASEDGEYNARVNSVGNVTFTTEKIKNYLKSVIEQGGMPPGSSAIVDPPRSGMVPKAVRRLIALRPAHILYVSCNPRVFARELPAFLDVYRLTDLRAIDMFPHTDHVELLASFSQLD